MIRSTTIKILASIEHTGDFEVRFPKNAVFGASEGSSKAVGDGYYVITEPLSKGTYTIQYKSSLICPGTDCLEPNFAQDIKYNIEWNNIAN
jgi:hypothetical protein